MRRAEGVRGGLIEARYGAAMDRALTLAAGAGRAGEVPVGAVVLGPDGEALAEAERRVATIATVHEALSHNVDEKVDFDEVFASILRGAALVATATGAVTTRLEGAFGTVDADTAQALATVLAELVTNAVEHGLGDRDGTVTVRALRDGQSLEVHVIDDGVGLEPGAAMTGLGTRIVSTLVHGELRGTIDWLPIEGGHGSDVVVRARLTEA